MIFTVLMYNLQGNDKSFTERKGEAVTLQLLHVITWPSVRPTWQGLRRKQKG